VVRVLVASLLVVTMIACSQTSTGGGEPTSPGSDGGDASDDLGAPHDDGTFACVTLCPVSESAKLNFSCAATLVGVDATGPCGVVSCIPKQGPCAQTWVSVLPTGAGLCHVDLTFEGGFRYSTDVTFASMPGNSGLCPCSPFIGPTQETFTVDNPASTCADAGLEGTADGGTDTGPAGTDAGADAVVDARDEGFLE
jgi:hypothetical protein